MPAISRSASPLARPDSTAAVSSTAHLPDPVSPLTSTTSTFFGLPSLPSSPSSSSSSSSSAGSPTSAFRTVLTHVLPLRSHRPPSSAKSSSAAAGPFALVSTRLVRPTCALALVLLFLHLVLGRPPSIGHQDGSAFGWPADADAAAERGRPPPPPARWPPARSSSREAGSSSDRPTFAQGTHHLVWDAESASFVSRPGSPFFAGGDGGRGRRPSSSSSSSSAEHAGLSSTAFEDEQALARGRRPDGTSSGSAAGSTTTAADDDDEGGWLASHDGLDLPPGVVLYATSARLGLSLETLVTTGGGGGGGVIYRPKTAFDTSLLHAETDDDGRGVGGEEAIRRRRPQRLERALESRLRRLDAERAMERGGGLASSTAAAETDVEGSDDDERDDRNGEDKDDEVWLRSGSRELNGIVLGSCLDDLPALDGLLRRLASHRAFSLACSHPYDLAPSAAATASERSPPPPSPPWALLAPYARAGYLALLAPSDAQAEALRQALASRAGAGEEAAGEGWEFVPVVVVRPFGTASASSSAAGPGRRLLDGEVDRLVLAHAQARSQHAPSSPQSKSDAAMAGKKHPHAAPIEPGARRKLKELRNVAIVVDDGPASQGQVERFLGDMVLEIAADPKFWGYSNVKKDGGQASYAPLHPSTTTGAANTAEGDEAVDDRFTVTLLRLPPWLRPPPSSVQEDEGPTGRKIAVPPELATHAVRLVDGAAGGSSPAAGGAHAERRAELAFWEAVVEADLVLDLGGGIGQDLAQLLSIQTQTPILNVQSAASSRELAIADRPSTPDEHNVLRVPLALHPAEVIRTLRRGAADGVDLGRHWKLRQQIVQLLQRGIGWQAPSPPVSVDEPAINIWKEILVRPF